jgi:hypothetical protein
MEKDRICNPLWPTFGCKTYSNKGVPIGTTGGTADEEAPSLWENLTSWWSGSAEDTELQVIQQDIPGNYIEPQTNVSWNSLAVPAIVLGGLGVAIWQDKRMNRGAKNERY